MNSGSHCLISGILGHSDHQYGFKLSFFSTEEAKQAKQEIIEHMKTKGYIVTVRKAYHD